MAWNRSTADYSLGNESSKTSGRKVFAVSSRTKATVGLVSALVLIGGGVFWYLGSSDETADAPARGTPPAPAASERTQEIRTEENAPVAAAKPCVSEPQPKTESKPKLSKAWQMYYDGRDTNKWKVVYNPLTGQEYLSRIVSVGLKRERKPPIFKARALNLLNTLAFKEISRPLVGIKIDERFMRSLQEGLIEKIEINADDDEATQATKKAMKELQKELVARLKGGEDLRQLIQNAVDDANNVAALKHMMVNERQAMEESGASQEDIDEFTKLCNEKLESHGGQPLMTRKDIEEIDQGN